MLGGHHQFGRFDSSRLGLPPVRSQGVPTLNCSAGCGSPPSELLGVSIATTPTATDPATSQPNLRTNPPHVAHAVDHFVLDHHPRAEHLTSTFTRENGNWVYVARFELRLPTY